MNIIDNEVHTNAYMRAADIRCILHNIFITNKYGFSSLLINMINKSNQMIRLSEQNAFLADFNVDNHSVPSEIYYDYNIEENGFGHYSKLSTIDTTMYVECLSIFSNHIKSVVDFLEKHNHEYNIPCEDLDKIYEFITTDLPTTKSSVAMLFDIRIYMNHLVVSI